jgi:hypothetical protein
MTDLKEKIEEILNEFFYNVDSDYGDKTFEEGTNMATDQLLALIEQEKAKEESELTLKPGDYFVFRPGLKIENVGKSVINFKIPSVFTQPFALSHTKGKQEC